jgi:hypothetical protein
MSSSVVMIRRLQTLGPREETRQFAGVVDQDGKVLRADSEIGPLVLEGDQGHLL